MSFDLSTPPDAVSTTIAGDSGGSMCATHCSFPKEAFATKEEVRYAHELRLRLREYFLRRTAPPPRPWSVGAD